MRYFLFMVLAALMVGCNGCSSSKSAKGYTADSTSVAHINAEEAAGGSDDAKADSTVVRPRVRVGESMSYEKVDSIMKLQEEHGVVMAQEEKLAASEKMLAEMEKNPQIKAMLHAQNAQIMDESIGISSTKGIIAYSVPDTMKVGKDYSIKVRITKEQGEQIKKTLVQGDHNMPINDVKVRSTITFDSVRVESIMSASLISADSAFTIKLLSSSTQDIDDEGYTEWEWNINPQQAGSHPLKLLLTVRKVINGVPKDIVVFEKSIKTQSNYAYNVKRFASKNWHYLMSSIIIPLVGWWWKRRQDKKKAKNTEDTSVGGN